MASNFAEKMGRSRDEELIRIAFSDKAEGFLPAAIAAAREELDRRGVTSDDIETVREDVAFERAAEAARVEEPLSNGAWLALVIVGPITFWPVIILYARGHRQKTKDALHATLVGFALWGLLAVVIALLGG